MTKENSELKDPLAFLSPRLRELLMRLSKIDRRDPLQQLAWYIDEDSKGKFTYNRDGFVNPRCSLTDLPERELVQSVGSFRRVSLSTDSISEEERLAGKPQSGPEHTVPQPPKK